ncbi:MULTISPECIES: chorismate mutase [Brevibacterium]|uniref:chorismate mutase n=1 Tax=Brevibacterium TaxID=1696 RepID=UPI00158589BD|nr:chorismate mutase [Brevibacterium sp. p3-SID960]MCT1691357.1 chorismate mutase [Brevibacterium sp. p3-SID960]NUL60718.1 chorismate mutase [Brevibacterium luteolum]
MSRESADPQSAASATGPQADTSTASPAELTRLRNSIDNVDAALIHILAERFKLTEAVGRLKASSDLPPADPAREARQVERLRSLAEESHLDPEFAEKFLTFIVAEVIRHHERIAEENRDSSA